MQVLVPPLPEKKVNFKLSKLAVDKFDEAFVRTRQHALNVFLQRLSRHPVLRRHAMFHDFLTHSIWHAGSVDPPEVSTALDSVKSFMGGRSTIADSRIADLRSRADTDANRFCLVLDALERHAAARDLARNALDKMAEAVSALGAAATTAPDWIAPVHEHLAGLRDATAELHQRDARGMEAVAHEQTGFCDNVRLLVARQQTVKKLLDEATETLGDKQKTLDDLRNPGQQKGLRGLFSGLVSVSETERVARTSAAAQQVRDATAAQERLSEHCKMFTDSTIAEGAALHVQQTSDVSISLAELIAARKAYCTSSLEHWRAIRASLTAAGPPTPAWHVRQLAQQ
eukprot:m.90764 g.90764  ORF g.90764 m.90764 type:complete len:342 (-) comp13704_c0_seq5:43-1068(-)